MSVSRSLSTLVASGYHRLRRSPAGPLMLRAIDRATRGRSAVAATVRAGPLTGMTLELDPRIQADVVIGAYERAATDAIVRHLRPGDVAFDVGSHFGYFALLMSSAVTPGGRVVCFEPDPEIVPTLERNLARNSPGRADVAAVNAAVAGSAGTRRFARGGQTSRGSLSDSGDVEVRAPTPDAAVAEHGVPKLVKVDVEGAEPWVLRGAEAIIRRSRELTIVVEFRPTLPQGGLEPLEALALYRSLGLELYAIRRDGRVTPAEPAELVEQRSEGGFTNIVLRKA